MTQQRWLCTASRAVGAVKRGPTFRYRVWLCVFYIDLYPVACKILLVATGQSAGFACMLVAAKFSAAFSSLPRESRSFASHLPPKDYARTFGESAACSVPHQEGEPWRSACPLNALADTALALPQLLESPTFVGGVQALHGSVTRIQQGAYDTLLQATGEQGRTSTHAQSIPALVLTCRLPRHSASAHSAEEYDRKDPSHHLKDQATATTHRPRADESPREQNKELLAFIERTKRELEKEQNGKR